MVVYMATCLINNKSYIGITTQLFRKRKSHHLNAAENNRYKNVIFHKALRKYGPDNFEWKIIANAKDQQELKSLEIKLISDICTMSPNGYNMTLGGESSYICDELKEAKRVSSIGRKHTDEAKRKCKESKMDDKNPMSKRVLCVETGEIFGSQSSAARFAGVKQALIWMVINKKRGYHTAGGFHWESVI